MKYCSLLILNLLIMSQSLAQTLTPNQTRLVWGGEIVEYTRSQFDNCSIRWRVSGGVFIDFHNAEYITTDYLTVRIKWDNIAISDGKITFERTGCATQSNNGSKPFPGFKVMSLNGENIGNIAISSPIPICSAGPRTFTTGKVQIPNSTNKFASGYEWTIPYGWTGPNGQTGTFFVNSPDANSVVLTPSTCASGPETIRVRAYTNTEDRGTPHYSNYSAPFNVERTPKFEITVPAEIKCGIPFQASVTELACASSYTWTVPTGWTVTGTGRTVTITPVGTDLRQINARASLPSGCIVYANPVNVTPARTGKIVGPAAMNVCLPSTTYTLSDAPINSTITWSVSPANRVVTATGTGTTANLVPSSNPGPATLTFTISGSCSYPVSEPISVGPIQSSSIFISAFDEPLGGYPYVCPNGVYVTTIHPVNENYTYEVQVTNGFATPYGQSPGMFVININSYSPSQYADAAVSARVNNGCGWSDWRGISLFSDPFACPPGGGGCSPGSGDICLLLYPNPSSEEVSVSLLGIEENEMKTGQKLGEGMIYLYDSNGTLRKSASISKEKTLYIRDLPAGQYVLNYQNGKTIIKRQLKIER